MQAKPIVRTDLCICKNCEKKILPNTQHYEIRGSTGYKTNICSEKCIKEFKEAHPNIFLFIEGDLNGKSN